MVTLNEWRAIEDVAEMSMYICVAGRILAGFFDLGFGLDRLRLAMAPTPTMKNNIN